MPLDTTVRIDEAAPYNHRIGTDAMPTAMQTPPSPQGSHLTDLQRAIIWPNFSTAQRDAAASVLGMGTNLVWGDGAMKNAPDNTHCVAIGHRALEGDPNVPEVGHNYGCTAIGFRTFGKMRGGRYSIATGIDCCSGVVNGDYITATGAHIATLCPTVISSILMGVSTCYGASEATDSIVIGDNAADGGPDHVSVKVKKSLIIGHRAARFVSGEMNFVIGHDAMGAGALIGSYNHAQGRSALKALAGTSQGNTAVGDGANTGLVNGHETTAIGHNTSVMHSYSTAVGSGATSTKPYQVMLGGPSTKEVTTPGAVVLRSIDTPARPAAGSVALYAANVNGKTRVMALFATGAPQTLVIQP